jgi:zinc transport system substrate-binding protein
MGGPFRALLLWIPLMAAAAAPHPAFPGGAAESAESPGTSAARALSAYVSILPEAQFVERVGGGRVSVEVLVQPGQSPHSFEPAPRQMAALSDANVYFRIGVEFENTLMPRVESTMRNLAVVDLRQGIRMREIEANEAGSEANHQNEQGEPPGGSSAHGSPDPHIWMDPRNVEIMASTIRDALTRLDPEGRQTYEEGCRSYTAELDALHHRISRALAPLAGRTLFVYHPAFGYFADAYGLEQVAVEIRGTEPSARQLAQLIDTARARGVRVLFVQPQFSRVGAEAVARAIDGAVVPIDALARDYAGNLEGIAAAVEKALRP